MSTIEYKASTDIERNATAGLDGNGNPLRRSLTNGTALLPAFGGEFQPGLYKPSFRKFANPAPLGLCSFALTTFVLSLVNVGARGLDVPNVVVALAYGYGGLAQLLAGMWEMAVGNTFGATALSSFGGFWFSWALIESDAFGIVSAYSGDAAALHSALGFYLIGWFIFTTILLFCTLKSTLAFFSLFFMLDITFLLLAISHFQTVDGAANPDVTKAAGIFGILTAFIAWWNAFAGIADATNSFFVVPVLHFPWSDKVRSESKAD
ncbi:Meiotically up-regulated protein 86 protein [Rhizina undulata]